MGQNWNLQLFAEEWDSAKNASGAQTREDAAPVSRAALEENASPAQKNQDAADGMSREEWEELVRGRGRTHFDTDVQRIVRNRLRASKASEDRLSERLGKDEEALRALAEKCGLDVSEPGSLEPERLMEALKDAPAKDAQQDAANRAYLSLLRQAASLKSMVPGFNLDQEMANPAFSRMVLQGVPMESAFFAVHHRQIEQAQRDQQIQLARYAIEQTRQKTANAIAAGAARPSENGLNHPAASVSKTDPRRLSKADRAEIRRRVARGEKIRL